jgi:hypothetical protein
MSVVADGAAIVGGVVAAMIGLPPSLILRQ